MHRSDVALLIDFDGTISEKDVMDMLVQHLAGDALVELEQHFRNGELTHGELNQKLSKLIKSSREDLIEYLNKNVQLRDGFLELYAFCKNNRIPLIVLSAGWDIYINFTLDKFQISHCEWTPEVLQSKDYIVGVVSNRLVQTDHESWQVELRKDMGMCDLSSPCKGTLARELISLGYTELICAGNGNNDLCMAQEAKWVFARDSLAKVCTRDGISFQFLTSFKQILDLLKQELK